MPRLNVVINGREVDAFLPEHNLIVELDGRGFHMDVEAFEDDRDRHAANLRHRLATVRVTRERMTESAGDEAARLQDILRGQECVLGSSYGLLPEL